MVVLQLADVLENGDRPGLDAAVVAVDGPVLADFRILERDRLLLAGEQFDIVAQRALVALQRKNVIGLLVDDCLRDFALATRGVDVTTAPSMSKSASSAGMATISLDLSPTLVCPSTMRWRAAKAETTWMGSSPPFFW